MNDFLKEKYNIAINKAESDNYRNYISNYFKILNELGINNEESLKKFHYLCQYIPPILNKIYNNGNKEIKASIMEHCFKSAKNSSFEELINNIIEAFSVCKLVKVAYPSTGNDAEMLGEKYDVNKWMKALNDIYIRTRLFGNKQEAVDYITSKWGSMDEKIDFERWVKYYEQGGASLYKSAQGIPMLPLQAVPGLNIKNVPVYEDISEVQEKKVPDRKEEIYKIRAKIIGRINSAKRLLTSQYGIDFAGQDYNKLLRMLLDLERDLLTIKTAALLEDILYRAKNRMEKSGCDENAIQLFKKIAQLPPLGDATQTQPQTEQAEKPQDPEKGKESLQSFIESLKEVSPKAISENVPKDFAETVKTKEPQEKETASKQRAGQTVVSAWANINTPEFLKFKKVASGIEKIAIDAKNHLYTVAQLAAPEAVPATVPVAKPAPAAPGVITAPEEAKEVAETPEEVKPKKKDEKIVPEQGISTKELLNIDTDPIEDALKNIKLPEVITRLQALSRVFKNREIARQLAIIDLMLDRLGISGFFPSLAEATRSALESNQYCQSRVEEILAKLVSATDEIGQSILYQSQTSEPDNIVDKEMDKYIKDEEEKGEEVKPNLNETPAPAAPKPETPTTTAPIGV